MVSKNVNEALVYVHFLSLSMAGASDAVRFVYRERRTGEGKVVVTQKNVLLLQHRIAGLLTAPHFSLPVALCLPVYLRAAQAERALVS